MRGAERPARPSATATAITTIMSRTSLSRLCERLSFVIPAPWRQPERVASPKRGVSGTRIKTNADRRAGDAVSRRISVGVETEAPPQWASASDHSDRSRALDQAPVRWFTTLIDRVAHRGRPQGPAGLRQTFA